MVASEEGQCFIVLRRVRPGKVSRLPALMAANQVGGTGLPVEAWQRWTRAMTLGRLYTWAACDVGGGGMGWTQGFGEVVFRLVTVVRAPSFL